MSIIEKLGKKPLKKYGLSFPSEIDHQFNEQSIRELEQQNNELLKALIKLHRHFDNSKSWGNFDSKYYAFMQITRPLIEKATGKSCEEIKQLADTER